MNNPAVVALVLVALALLGLAVWYWVRTLNEVTRNETDPAERRKWWWRVFLLRFIGIAWYRSHRRERDREQRSAKT